MICEDDNRKSGKEVEGLWAATEQLMKGQLINDNNANILVTCCTAAS
jgi:hypothetical protein